MTTAAIDFAFRPASYWDPADPESAVVGNIKGQLRREMVRDFLRSVAPEELGELEAQYLADEVDDDFRVSLGRIHPHFMGGEYLPRYLPGEVEIVRIVLQSSTLDVHSLRARRRSGRIRYRMVDEYESAWTLRQQTSRRPLTFGQLVDLILSAQDDNGLAGDYPMIILDYNTDEGGGDPEAMAGFVGMESVFYPQLGQWWQDRVAEWLAGRQRLAEDEEE
jgi:hypothetical protein